MMVDGERLKTLLAGAERRVLLCAPFIKAKVLKTLLSVVAEGVEVRIVTRWRPEDVATGVSDLEVFEIANGRLRTELALLDDLHAKLYVADDECLLGSANLTARALGWAEPGNVELLAPARVTDLDVAVLLGRLEAAELATFARRSEVAAAAAELGLPKLGDGTDVAEWSGARLFGWLPRCAAPDKLYDMYRDRSTTVVAEETRDDGLADLRDFKIRPGLTRDAFIEAVRDAVQRVPSMSRILSEVPRGVTDSRGIAFVEELRPGLSGVDAAKQWGILRDWIGVFFAHEFEVAPESFVTRLKAP